MMRAPDEATRVIDADVADGGGDRPAAVETADRALSRARDVLVAAGIAAQVERAGHLQDVLVVRAQASTLTILHGVTDDLRALGFRYVTIDITDA